LRARSLANNTPSERKNDFKIIMHKNFQIIETNQPLKRYNKHIYYTTCCVHAGL
jgi:hypothetical protein